MTALSDELRALLAPQKRFDALRGETALRAGRRLCDFSYANPYEGPGPEVMAALRGALESERQLDFQYTPFGGSTITRRLVAQQLSRSHGCRFGWRDIIMTPGAMAALNLFFRGLRTTETRDEVVVVTPCWQDVPLYIAQQGMHCVPAPLAAPAYRLDLDKIASSITPSTRAIVLSQPANPTGVAYREDELAGLGDLLESVAAERGGHGPWLLSDECHRDWVFEEDAEFVSPVRTYDRVCVVYSFGKAHLLQGQRTGYLAVSPRAPEHREWAAEFEDIVRAMGFCTPTSLMQIAVRELLNLSPDVAPLKERRDRFHSALSDAGYEVTPSDGTFFLYARCPGEDDFAFAEHLAEQGVLILPSSIFHEPGHFRVSLTASDEMLERALPIFRTARQGGGQ